MQRIVVVSIIGTDRFTGGYGAAKQAHERATLSGPIPAGILRAAQFHEFVAQLVDWGRQDGVSYVPKMRTQLVAARSVAEALADLATGPESGARRNPTEHRSRRSPVRARRASIEMARLLVARRGDPVRIEGVSVPADFYGDLNESGALLPGPHATLAGPSFEEWLSRET